MRECNFFVSFVESSLFSLLISRESSNNALCLSNSQGTREENRYSPTLCAQCRNSRFIRLHVSLHIKHNERWEDNITRCCFVIWHGEVRWCDVSRSCSANQGQSMSPAVSQSWIPGRSWRYRWRTSASSRNAWCCGSFDVWSASWSSVHGAGRSRNF